VVMCGSPSAADRDSVGGKALFAGFSCMKACRTPSPPQFERIP
jgi:hypothetical protein